MGGGGGATGGAGLAEVGGGGGGGGGAIEGLLEGRGGGGGGGRDAREGALDVGGSGGGAGGWPLGFLETGGGGGGFPSAMLFRPGFGAGLGGGFLRFANGLGTAGAESEVCAPGLSAFILGIGGALPPGRGGAAPGGRGGSEPGALGAEGLAVVSESEYEPCSSAPVEIPPLVFLSLGIPPAKSPPNCGAASIVLVDPPPVSLLLRFLFKLGGASPAGGLIPGTGGAPPIGPPPPPELDLVSTIGADLSLVTVDFNLFPLLISDNSAPYRESSV